MKRILSITLVVLLVAALFVSCASAPAKIDPVGKYYIKSVNGQGIEDFIKEGIEEEDMDMELADFLAIVGISSADEYITFEFKADGTVIGGAAGEEQGNGTWKLDGDKIAITFDGETKNATLIGNELTISVDGETLVLVKK